MATRFAAHDSHRGEPAEGGLAFRERGAGEPVVFVHGDLSDLRTWDRQLESVGSAYRAIAYSRRHAWPAPDVPPGGGNPLSRHVDDLVALLLALDAAPAHLVGNSSGAFICLLAAIAHPGVVRSLVLCEPPVLTLFVGARPRPAELLRLAGRRPRTAAAILRFGATTMGPAEKAFRRGDDEAALLTFVDGVLGLERFAALPESRRQQARANVPALKALLLGDGLPPLDEADVRRIGVPTLLVGGAESPPLFARLTDRLEELVEGAVRAEIPGASHVMHEENAEAFDAELMAFLRGAGG